MKIAAYGCREDEIKYFEELKKRPDLKLITTTEHLSPDNVNLAQGAKGVSIEGLCRASCETLEKLYDIGVRFLSTRTVGYNNIDVDAAREIGIRCSNVSYSPYSVAEYTVLLMLASIRKFIHLMARSAVLDYSLRGMQGKELRNMTVGIIGMGRIGKAVARCLSGFGCRLIAYTPHPDEESGRLADMVAMDKLYEQADIISLHTPLKNSNYHMINSDTISRMKDGVIIINTARGELIDTEALINAVDSGKVSAVGIDTFENERNVIHIDHEAELIHNRNMLALKAYPNVIVSPHAAYYTDQASKDMVYCSIDGLASWISGGENENEIK